MHAPEEATNYCFWCENFVPGDAGGQSLKLYQFRTWVEKLWEIDVTAYLFSQIGRLGQLVFLPLRSIEEVRPIVPGGTRARFDIENSTLRITEAHNNAIIDTKEFENHFS